MKFLNDFFSYNKELMQENNTISEKNWLAIKIGRIVGFGIFAFFVVMIFKLSFSNADDFVKITDSAVKVMYFCGFVCAGALGFQLAGRCRLFENTNSKNNSSTSSSIIEKNICDKN